MSDDAEFHVRSAPEGQAAGRTGQARAARCAGGMLAALLLSAGPAAAKTPADRIVDELQRVCTVPGVDLDRRLALLGDGWRAADAGELDRLRDLLAREDFARLTLHGVPAGDPELARTRFLERLDAALARTPEQRRGAGRLLVNAADRDLALSIFTQSGAHEAVSCKMLVLDPDPAQLAGLALRFSLVPPLRDRSAQIWEIRGTRQIDRAEMQYARYLVVLRDDSGVSAAILEFRMDLMRRT